MPKTLLWFIAVALAGIFYVIWDSGNVPARVTVMNQAASPVRDILMSTDHERIEVGTLRSGESRSLPVRATAHLEITYRWGEDERRWAAVEPLRAGQPLVLYVTTTGRVAARSRLGATER